MCFLKPSFIARSPLRPFTRSPQPTAMKQGTRRRMEQPINACGQFACFTLRATCEIRKFLLMRLRWRVLTKKAFHFFTRIVKSSSSSFMVLPTDRPTCQRRGQGLMWMPSGDCRQFHLARVGNSSDAGHAVFEGSFSCIST